MSQMSAVPCLLSIGVLGLILILREYQSQRMIKGLIDKVLISRGSNEIPEEHPLAEAIGKLSGGADHEAELRRQSPKEKRIPVNFNIPGMDVAKAMFAQRDKK